MHFSLLPERWGGVLIPISIAATTVAAVTITEKMWPQEGELAQQGEGIAKKSSSTKVCSEGSTSVIQPNVYAFLLENKALPVPGPTIEIDCNSNVSYGVYPSPFQAGSGQRKKD